MRRLEDQVFAGNGTGQNLRGILNTTGVASVAYDAAELPADLTLEAIVDVLLTDSGVELCRAEPARPQKSGIVGSTFGAAALFGRGTGLTRGSFESIRRRRSTASRSK